MKKLRPFALLLSILAACAPPTMTPRRGPVPKTAEHPTETAPATEQATVALPGAKHAIIISLHSEGDADALLKRLESDLGLKLTLVLPADYFETQNRGALVQRFAALQTSGQIDIALSLDNEPNLPLLADLKVAGEKVEKWGFTFAWPDDASAQTARGSGRYRKRWGQLPSGFAPPHGAVSETVMQVLRQFRLSWVLVRPGDTSGVRFFGGTALIVPPIFPIDDATPAQALAKEAVKHALNEPFTHILSDDYSTPDFESGFVAELSRTRASSAATLVTVSELTKGLRNEYELPAAVNPFLNDHAAWVQSPLQKRAWQALAEARQVVETYKNSGRANLNRLDAAIEEMCAAESGPFLLSLADPQASVAFGQRNFLATLANVYRLAGVSVPSNLTNWFADRSVSRGNARSSDNDRPFFVNGAQSLTWNDPKGDDNGAGEFVYPMGSFAKGTFDLRDITISWTDSDVTFSASVAELARGGSVAITPLTDIYIDVNRLSEAGNTAVLSRRGQAVVERDAAWEYAVALTPRSAALYQGLPGGEQRLLMTVPAIAIGNSFSGSFSRKTLRGEPRQWRITAASGGAEVTARTDAGTPIAVQPTASQNAFGGAPGPRLPPHYVDILAPTVEAQTARLKTYLTGTVILPYVEAE